MGYYNADTQHPAFSKPKTFVKQRINLNISKLTKKHHQEMAEKNEDHGKNKENKQKT